MKTESEFHIIILWENSRIEEERIISDVSSVFDVRRKYYIRWDEKVAYQNFSRFYALKSRYAKSKMKHCGSGEFVLLVVEDLNPVYEDRQTNDGVVEVNKNIFDKKTLYRSWVGGGHMVHTTNSVVEAAHNIALFFGVSYASYVESLKEYSEVYLNQNLIGYDGWETFEQLFTVLNGSLNYIVLRNFEGFFDQLVSDEHLDIDLLVNNYQEARLVMNGKELYPCTNRVVNQVLVAGEWVNFDLRSPGDGYMSHDWESDLLIDRIIYKDMYYRPNTEMYFYSLLYHSLVHKEKISDDYLNRFISMGLNSKVSCGMNGKVLIKEVLLGYMNVNKYVFAEPKDLSVFYNSGYLDLCVSKKRKFVLMWRSCKRWLKHIFQK